MIPEFQALLLDVIFGKLVKQWISRKRDPSKIQRSIQMSDFLWTYRIIDFLWIRIILNFGHISQSQSQVKYQLTELSQQTVGMHTSSHVEDTSSCYFQSHTWNVQPGLFHHNQEPVQLLHVHRTDQECIKSYSRWFVLHNQNSQTIPLYDIADQGHQR